ncbi:MAG: reverse transcriptase family protein, partial [Candidatus Thiodiazotropha taylori]|nr:reverse transcriptase family protein [Candidatus Thiodiazotropha taylori]MCW4285655.1 reverse transcriptase family protein [Candidatus Thiodiazotropha taylori]
YTTDPDNIAVCFVSHFSISDHLPVCFTRKINHKTSKIKHITTSYRCFKHFNEPAFLSDIARDLNMFTPNSPNIDEDFNTWHLMIMKQLDKHAPIKTKRVKSKRLPEWHTPEITNLQKLRDNCKRQNQWAEYKKYRNKIKQLIRNAKRNFFTNSVINNQDSKTIWKHLREVKNGTNPSSSQLPEELIIDDVTFTNSNDIAYKLNKYFCSIAEILNEPTDEPCELDLSKLENFIRDKVPDEVSFKIPLITCEQVSSFINYLDTNKATGLDGLGPRIIKMLAPTILPSITMLINKSINSGVFPSQLKLAKVLPIFKGGSKSDPSNYRPISILPTVSKIFEKHVNFHLMRYLNKYEVLHESQSGFRQKHSCQTALIKLVDHWMTCIDNGDIVGTLFVDFRKAFDLVDHATLIKKLSLYKICSLTLKWFESYLSCRQQMIVGDDGPTAFTQVRSGVPQGSILGPTLFLLFINDLPLFLEHCFCDLFADDATFHTHSKDIDSIETYLQTDFNNGQRWGIGNKMQINYKKTSCMTAGTRNKLANNRPLNINAGDTRIETVSKQKLLGVYIDENLSWSAHIDHLCISISSKISLLRQLSHYVPRGVLKQFYQGYILPLIDYGSITWGSTCGTNVERLLKLQKRAARIILNAGFDTPSVSMFKELGWLSVGGRLKYNKAVLTYKALNDLAPDYIASLLKPMSQAHSLNLRSTENGSLHVPRSRTKLYNGSFSCSAPRLWNSLPHETRNSKSLYSFKKSLKSTLRSATTFM